MKPGHSSRPLRATRTVIAPTLAVLVLALTGACNNPTPAENCIANGGVVETETKYKVKNGKRTITTEHECIKDGVEIDEW